MPPALTFAMLLAISSLPALLPHRKYAAIGLVLVFGLWIAGGAYLLHDLERNPSGGDGPAFFAIAFLMGLGQCVVLLSLTGRVLAEALVSRIAPGHCQRVIAYLLGIGTVPVVLAALSGFNPLLVGLAAIAGFPLLWMGMAMALLLKRASRQTLLRA